MQRILKAIFTMILFIGGGIVTTRVITYAINKYAKVKIQYQLFVKWILALSPGALAVMFKKWRPELSTVAAATIALAIIDTVKLHSPPSVAITLSGHSLGELGQADVLADMKPAPGIVPGLEGHSLGMGPAETIDIYNN